SLFFGACLALPSSLRPRLRTRRSAQPADLAFGPLSVDASNRKLTLEPGKIAFPLSVGRRQRRESRHDVPTPAERIECTGRLAKFFECDCKFGVRVSDITLPLGVAGIGLRQPLSDGEAVTIGFQRPRKVAFRFQCATNADLEVRKITLPSG